LASSRDLLDATVTRRLFGNASRPLLGASGLFVFVFRFGFGLGLRLGQLDKCAGEPPQIGRIALDAADPYPALAVVKGSAHSHDLLSLPVAAANEIG
jgi:hypothetical protein